MRACVRLDNWVCSGWFAVEQGLRQGCVLAPLLFNIFAAVVNVVYTRFKANKEIVDALVHLSEEEENGAKGRGESTAGEPALATLLWSMLHADEAGVVSQSPEQPRKMIWAIVVVCAAFGVLTHEGDAGGHHHIQRRDSRPGVQPNERVCIPRGKRRPQCRPVHRGRPVHAQRIELLPEVHPRTVRPTERSPRTQNPDAKSETMLYDCVTWSPHA